MLKITRRPSTAASQLSSNTTTLSVSWLGGEFRAVAVHRGKVEGTWQPEQPVEGVEHFPELVRQAVEQTGFKGSTVTLLLGHPRMIYQLEEMPPAKGASIVRLIGRKAQQQRLFPGEAAWSYQPVLSTKGGQRVLINLFPKILLDQLCLGAVSSGLFLTSLLPPAVVMQDQLAQLPGDEEEVTMLVAETGGTTQIVVGRRNGQLLLARTLQGTWNTGAEQFALDLKRTILFVNQQFDVTIRGAWLFGPGAETHLAVIQGQLHLPVKLSPVPWTDFYWATEALRLSAVHTSNFIGREQQRAPQKKILSRILAVAIVLLVLVAVGFSTKLFFDRRTEMDQITALRLHKVELEAKHLELQQLHAECSRRQQLVTTVSDGRVPPVPGWFLGYLSEATPADLVVTNLQVRREDGVWKVVLGGLLQADGRTPDEKALEQSFSTLTNRLATGPFHLRLGSLADFAKPAAKPAAKSPEAATPLATWLAQLGTATPKPPKPATVGTQFSIEGVMLQ